MESLVRRWTALIAIVLWLGICGRAEAAPVSTSCQPMGWFPSSFGLKDHTVFSYNGYYYLASIYLSPETQFAYGRSTDLCNWENLSPILTQRIPGSWDEAEIWAPFVYQESNTFYMYYTGVTDSFAQSIMLATSTDPADPNSWQPQGMIFQPNHSGMVWGGFNTWSDCRDPTVVKLNGIYYLYYTGLDQTGGIVGVATATSPRGPWTDWGAVLTAPPGDMAESSTIWSYRSAYYLFYHDTSQGEFYRIGPGPTGPWSQPFAFAPGWAHEIWQGQDGFTYTSYLTNHTVTISRLTWDLLYVPPHPFIGANVYHSLLPMVRR